MLQEFPVFQSLQKLTNDSIFYLPYFGSDLPLWTLSIEWWLYMMFGWLLLSKNRNLLWYLILLIFSVVPIYQLFIGSRLGAGIVIYWFLGSLFPVLLFAFHNIKIKTQILPFAIVLIGALGFSYDFFSGAFVFLFGSFLLLKYYEKNTLTWLMKFKPIVTFFAGSSFSLYLIHYTLIFLLIALFPNINSWMLSLKLLVIFISVNVFAFIFAWLSEFRHQKIKLYLKNKIL